MKKATKIIVIMTDTQRWDMLGCYGSDLATPNLDRLAAAGVRFERAYTCQPVCGPARSAIFTGTFPHTNGSWGNSMALSQVSTHIGQRMMKKGYHTAYIGKWHLDGGDYFGDGICPDGWDPDYWYDMRCYLDELSEDDRLRSRKPKSIFEPDFTEEFTYGHRCSNRAIDFMEKHADEDYLLVVSYDEPHKPWLSPPEYYEMYKDYKFPRRPSVWDTLENKPEHQRIWAGENVHKNRDEVFFTHTHYFASHTFVDYEIGRVLDAIDAQAPDALVIYTSDHGDANQEHCLTSKGPAMYDGITRIPFLVRWPGVCEAGRVCPHPISHIDITPTILDAAGFSVPKTVQGKSLVPTFASADEKPSDLVFMEFGRFEVDHDGFGAFQPIRAAFNGRYKLVINLLTSDELYDMEADPDEMVNLIDDPAHTEQRDVLHDQLLNWMNETRDPFRGYYWERRPWRLNARPATWKYTGMTRQRENEEWERRQLDYNTGLDMGEATRQK